MNETKTNRKKLVITGVCTRAVIGKTKFNETVKNQLTIKSDKVPYDDIHAYDNCGAKLTPTWFKEKNGYVNLSSIYDIPVKDVRGNVLTYADWIDAGLCVGSEIKVAVTDKDGAVYPIAIVVLSNGEPFDPFEGM